METIKDCLVFMEFFEVVDYKNSRIFDNFEQMRECIITTYRERNFEMK